MKPSFARAASCALLLVASVTGSSRVGAQVGHVPESSPYIDLDRTQEWTFLYGEFRAKRDPAHAAPQSGPLAGIHYEWRFAGPAHFTGEIVRISSDRLLLSPIDTGAKRTIGTISRPLWAANAGIGLNLTGAKTWHHLAPEVNGGAGVVSDLRSVADSGGFEFGTRFAFIFAGGVRWIPGNSAGRFQIRGDITDRMYQISYPASFQSTPLSGPPLVPSSYPLSFWTHNVAFTIGLSYLLGR